jgi:hypothetical protein
VTLRPFSFILSVLVAGTSPSYSFSTLQTEQFPAGFPSAFVQLKDFSVREGQPPRFIIIEDLHTLPEAQGRIASLLVYAHHEWGTDQIFVEGAFNDLGPPPFPMFTVARGDRVANELLRQGRLSGAELAAAVLTNERPAGRMPVRVCGMEDPLLYRQNVEAFQTLQGILPEASARLRRIKGISSSQRTLLRKLLELRLTPSEYSRVRQMSVPEEATASLAVALGAARRFYQVADRRSHCFIRRALRAPRSAGPVIIVTGGFHTPAITKAFRRAGLSYAVLTPRLTQGARPAVYRARLQESADALRPAIEGPCASPLRILQLHFVKSGRSDSAALRQ